MLYDILNRKHFIEGGILNDFSLLLSAVDEVGGLDRHSIELYLQSNEGINQILDMVDIVHSYGIHGIPVLVINGGQAIISGAAHADEVLIKLREVRLFTPIFSIFCHF